MLNIEFYSKQNRVNTNYPNKTNINEIILYFKDKKWIAVDTETTGFDPYTQSLYCIQLGDKNKQFVIDLGSFSIKELKSLLETNNLIFQNAKFDLRFLYHNNIYPDKVYDTFLAETKINQGRRGIRRDLGNLEKRYCNSEYVDKGDRGLIHKQGFTDRVVKYCGGDVAVLHEIKEKQEIKAKKLGLTEAIRLENEFVLCLAYTEYCGIYLDPVLWTKKTEIAKKKLEEAAKKLNKYVLDNNLTDAIDPQLDLFTTERRIKLNWNSDTQVKPIFKKLGINIKVKEKGVEKESIESSVLLPQIDKFDIIPLYLDYKKHKKDTSTYGTEFLRHINPVTKRIHTSFTQIVDTGRMASGGKQGKIETPNLQNIPADDTRKCFIAQRKENSLSNADYSGQEQIMLANKSKDRDLIAFYKKQLGDMHSFIASKIFEELKDMSLEDIKKYYPEKRQIAKSAGFAINYGGTGYTIANNLGISQKEGEAVEKDYFRAFPKLKSYFDKCENEAIEKGYILIDSLLGSKFFIDGHDKFIKLHEKYNFDNRDYWDKYKEEKRNNSAWYKKEKEEVSYYFRWKGVIRRMALNYPIQGSSASVTKLAGVYFFRWIKKENQLNKVLITNIVHDEIMTEQPKSNENIVIKKLKEYMEKAGSYYCPIIPLKADPKIVKYWSH